MNEKRRRANALMLKYYSGMIDEGSWKHASGDIAVFNTKYRRGLKSLTVQLEPIQAGSGDPSPDNVRPITGRTGATIYRTGKNIFNSRGLTTYSSLGITITENNGYLTFNGTASANAYFSILNLKLPYGNYIFSVNNTETSNVRISFRNLAGGYFLDSAIDVVDQKRQFTNSLNGVIIYVPANTTLSDFTIRPQLEEGITATPYAPYAGTTIPVSWETEAGTVYGGTVDIVSGKLIVDKTVTELNEEWYWYKGTTQPAGKSVVTTTYAPGRVIAASHYKKGTTLYIVNMRLYEFIISQSANNLLYICAANNDAYTANDFKDYIVAQRQAGTPIQILYELTNPLEYQLTPQQIQTLIGENVIWSDAGPVSAEYWS